ncbi:hypothetical protein [Rhizobium rhizoryzae]|uniref:hypothetical protein n=1 Tax=Rhizobium rhizoryzae TaxID=451876 RepID=UPI000DE57571|nr:hypothetical protein [Rhizobium rhizoryzae]
MIDILAPKSLDKAIGTRRETLQHLNCLTRQIAARAGRQVRSRARRRSGLRLYHQELADRLAFDRWGELDTVASRLAVQEQIIDALEHCGDAPVSPVAG